MLHPPPQKKKNKWKSRPERLLVMIRRGGWCEVHKDSWVWCCPRCDRGLDVTAVRTGRGRSCWSWAEIRLTLEMWVCIKRLLYAFKKGMFGWRMGFIFRVWWFQLLLLVGGSVDSTSQGPELLLTSPQLDQLLTLCVLALGELCLCHLHFLSLGILLDLFFSIFEKIWMLG